MQNPYVEMLGIMQRQGAVTNPPGIRLAEVVSSPPNIKIRLGELQIDKNNIWIADYLLPNYTRQITLGGDGEAITHDGGGSYSPYTTLESLQFNGSLTFVDTIKTGDVLAVIPTTDEQTYIILARVVQL